MDYVYNEKNVFKNSKNLNNINFFSTAIKNDKSIIDEVVLEGKSYYASFNPLDLKEWYVIFLIDKEYALNSLNSFKYINDTYVMTYYVPLQISLKILLEV